VPVWGATIALQERDSAVISAFGGFYDGLGKVATRPTLAPSRVREIVEGRAGVPLSSRLPVELYVLPEAAGRPRLVYTLTATNRQLERRRYFVDALDGSIVAERIESRNAGVVGVATGVQRDRKKISVSTLGSLFVAIDMLRPAPIQTYDMRGDMDAVIAILNGLRPLVASDLASDTDNNWTDGAVVDAHVYTGFTYDYLFKRFGRLGIDDRGLPMVNIVHPVHREDISRFVGGINSTNDAPHEVPDFFVNAGYLGAGMAVYGDGLPPGFVLVTPNGDVSVDYLSGALDIVAHEITHGVLEYTSNLDFSGESGALNEAFCDIIGTSVEFFFQQAGGGRQRAEYLIAEDVLAPAAARSMAAPATLSQPDHYSQRFRGTGDNGGVHINSGIPNHAFYLAIEGGHHPTSGVTVTGVGPANRAQIETAFYRAFTLMLPANATFSMARAATIQSAIDLFGAGSAAAAAITDAWTAVGVS
jgi:bacillolysin